MNYYYFKAWKLLEKFYNEYDNSNLNKEIAKFDHKNFIKNLMKGNK